MNKRLAYCIAAALLLAGTAFAQNVSLGKNERKRQELKQEQFLGISGLRDIMGGDIAKVNIYTYPDSGPCFNLLASCRISGKTLGKLLHDKFLDMWDNGDLPDDIVKETYLSLDFEKDKVPPSVRPSRYDHLTWMMLKASGRTRLYLICRDKDNGAATLYFFFLDLTQ